MLEKLKELRDVCIMQQAMWTNDLVECGDFTYGQPVVLQWDKTTRLTVGKFCSIGGNVQIMLGGEHHTEWLTTYPFDVLLDGKETKSKGNVKIGNGVWIGNNSIILSGVTIQDGAVIGAGTVVTKDVYSYEIFAGNPGRKIATRWAAAEAGKLKWWDWPIEKLAAGYKYLISNDVLKLKEFDRRWNDGLCDHA